MSYTTEYERVRAQFLAVKVVSDRNVMLAQGKMFQDWETLGAAKDLHVAINSGKEDERLSPAEELSKTEKTKTRRDETKGNRDYRRHQEDKRASPEEESKIPDAAKDDANNTPPYNAKTEVDTTVGRAEFDYRAEECTASNVDTLGRKRPLGDAELRRRRKRLRSSFPERRALEDDTTYSFRLLSYLTANKRITPEQNKRCRRILVDDLSKGLTASLMEYALDRNEEPVQEFVDSVVPRPPSLCEHIVHSFTQEIKRMTLRTITTKIVAAVAIAGTAIALDLKNYL